MTKIDPYRMLGRFDYALDYLMRKYNLSFTGNTPDYPILFKDLSNHVNEYDREFCEKMANASAVYADETRTSSLNQTEADFQRSLGSQEAEFIFNTQPDYADKLLQEKDYFIDIAEEGRRKKREARRNVIIGFGIIAVVIIGIIVYNLPYFAEQRAFSEIEKYYEDGMQSSLLDAVDEYKEKYPQGKHYSEVLYMPVKYAKKSGDIIETLDAVDNYIMEDPTGPYVKECKAISDSIWDTEINKYKAKAEASASKDGADFIMDMLQYMKRNNVRTIEVVGVPNLNLKEYDEYPPEVQKLWESVQFDPMPGMALGKEPKLPDDMVTIKDKITIELAGEWVEYVISALQDGFNKVLTPNFIVFKEIDKDNKNGEKKFPKVTVNYTVSTQEIAKDIPDIWTYTQTSYNLVTSSQLYLGIGMNFDADFTLPGEKIQYKVSGVGDAGSDDIRDVDPSDFYSKMCERSTQQFAEKIATEFGLKEQDSDK